ncbi:cytochrome P450 [Maribacter sp. 2-571]|uniref:cytochrome P450 n=1 Tax=Maribacter sp. 2-571 TaxID=3417569 RepID=UPI003D34C03F
MKDPRLFYKSYLMFANFQKFLQLNQQEFGDFYQYKGLVNFFFVHDLKQVKRVLLGTNKSFSKKTNLVRNLHNALGESIIISEYEKWKPRRKLLNPSFTKKNSLSLFSLMKIKISETIDEINQQIQDKEYFITNVSPIFNRLIINIIGMAFFNKDFDKHTGNIEHWLNNMRSYVENPPIPFLSNPNTPTLANLKMKRNKKRLLSFVKDIIEERKSSGVEYNDLLGRILKETSEDTETDLKGDELVMEVLNLIVAGHETTANTISWTLYYLTKNPDVYKKLQKEIDTSFGQNDPSSKKVMELQYLDCVLKETMRLVPAAWIFTRKSKEDMVFNEKNLKKDSTIIFCPILIHKDKRLWKNPEAYAPERFLPENKDKIQPDSYIPFGGGQRTCIGLHLAMIEMKITLVMILQKFEFLKNTAFKPKIKYSITTYSENGIELGIKRRS